MTGGEIYRMLQSQGFRCALSGRPLEPEVASLDHARPVVRGGSHDIANLQIVHCEVNSAKGTMTNEEFIAMCRDVVAHADRANA